MPQWFLGLICLVVLVGFIGFAFRQGMKVTPDPNNSNFGPGQTSGSGDWLDPGGHSS
jgi:hypothetical protein